MSMARLWLIFGVLCVLSAPVLEAGFPPTTVRGAEDSSKKTTFDLELPNIPVTHTGIMSTVYGSFDRNYINNSGAERDASGWSTYDDGASSSPVDGTAGATITTTWTRTTSSPLRFSGSFLVTKDAANRQGEGVSYDFTIDASDKGKVLQGSFEYAIASGTFADDDLSVWIYDVTNATLIQPAPYKLKNHSLAAEKFGFEFQTSTSSTSYRLIIHVASTSASAYTVKFDNFNVGPQAKLYGSPVTDWVSFTPSFGGITTGNGSSYGQWRRVGDSIEVHGRFVMGSTSSVTGEIQFVLPNGASLDVNKIPSPGTSNQDVLGIATALDSGTNYRTGHIGAGAGATYVRIVADAGGSNWGATVPFTWTTNDELGYSYKAPVVGWSSSVAISSDADTRVVSFIAQPNGNKAGVNPNGSVVTLQFDSVASPLGDTHGGFDTANYQYQVKVPGNYYFSTTVLIQGTNVLSNAYDVRIMKNGSTFFTGGSKTQVAGSAFQITASGMMPNLVAGDLIKVALYGAGNNSASTLTLDGGYNSSTFSGYRLSGPAQIAASETVAARYTTNNADTLNNGVNSTINFLTKVFDSHGSVSIGVGAWSAAGGGNATSNWKFTAPVAGTYVVACKLYLNDTSTFGGTNYWTHALYKNNALYSNLANRRPASGEDYPEIIGSSTIRLVAGDYIDVRANQNAGNIALLNDGNYNYIDIYRIGN